MTKKLESKKELYDNIKQIKLEKVLSLALTESFKEKKSLINNDSFFYGNIIKYKKNESGYWDEVIKFSKKKKI